MLVLCVAAVLGLLSAGQAAPLTCENLMRPVEEINLDKMMGKWYLIAESSEVPGSLTLGRLLVHGVWIEVTPTSDSKKITYTQIQKTLGLCYSFRFNTTLENNGLSIASLDCTQVVLSTDCADCLLLQSKCLLAGRTYTGLEILSKRREVNTAELESFRKQVECLNLPGALILNSKSDLCPHPDSPTDKENTVDFSDALDEEEDDDFSVFMNNVVSPLLDVTRLFEGILSLFLAF